MSSEIKISVIMPIYNCRDYLQESIESILNQTMPDFELIIVDDGSTDMSSELIRSYKDARIRLFEKENSGIAKSLNFGIRKAKSEIIARMDGDDICLPTRFETQYKFLSEHNDYVLVGSNAEIIDKDGEYIYTSNLPIDWAILKDKVTSGIFFHSSVMFRKQAVKKCGYYHEIVPHFEDTVLWGKMKKYGMMTNISQPLIKYRLTPNAFTTKVYTTNFEKKIRNKLINNSSLSSIEIDKFIKIREKQFKNRKKREAIYYYYLAKKFLWNANNSSIARYYLRKSIKLEKLLFKPYALLFFSFIPPSYLKRIHNG